MLKPFLAIVVIALALVACQATGQATTPPATPTAQVPAETIAPPLPTETSTSPGAAQVALRAPDGSIRVVDTNIRLDPASPPSMNSFLPMGGSVGSTVYGLDTSGLPSAFVHDARGTNSLAFVLNPSYGLAVWPGTSSAGPLLAWGSRYSDSDKSSSLLISSPDGTGLQTLLTESVATDSLHEIVAQQWSPDGKFLYFSKEPMGIGGYILFSGASSLYRIEVANKQVAELIPFDIKAGHFICLDAMSGDGRLVADHCKEDKTITVRDLTAGTSTTIQTPSDLANVGPVGSARFSPDGTRLAFALAKGDPNAEQGWVAVSDGLSGASKVILTGQPGEYYHVVGWLNAQTLLVQSYSMQCNPDCLSTLWTVTTDGAQVNKLADGQYLTLVGATLP